MPEEALTDGLAAVERAIEHLAIAQAETDNRVQQASWELDQAVGALTDARQAVEQARKAVDARMHTEAGTSTRSSAATALVCTPTDSK